MTAVLFTVDTELSPGFHQRGLTPLENMRRNVFGEVADGTWGIGYQMKHLNAHGLKGVFFVEALCAYMYDDDILKRIVGPILDAGHEVQLHLHTEWLKWIDADLVGERRGANIANFTFEDQRRLLQCGLEALGRAGALPPTAFRAGNYGANNDTLRALADLGLRYDSSHNMAYLGKECAIETEDALFAPARLEGLLEVPVTCFADYPGHVRPLQLCAASAAELTRVLNAATQQSLPATVVVSHSFELLNQARTRANRMLLRRFEAYCDILQSKQSEAASVNFADLDGRVMNGAATLPGPIVSNAVRTALRMIEQSVGTYLYDRT